MTQHGTTQRERIVNRLKTNLNNKLQDNPSYKTVKLNGEETNLIINTSTKPYYKEFQSLPDQKILAGDYVEWADSMWLVLNADSDDEVYTDGNLRQCQHCIYFTGMFITKIDTQLIHIQIIQFQDSLTFIIQIISFIS